MTDIEDAGRL